MANPSQEEVHVNRPLTNISIAFAADFTSVAETCFPQVPVTMRSDAFYVYDIGDMHRIEVKPRAPATESEGLGYRVTTDSYFCESFAIHKDIADEERANTDSPLEADQDAVMVLNHNMKLKKEKLFVDEFFTTGTWTGSTTGTDIVPAIKWDAASAIPIENIRAQVRSMHTKTGYKANTLVLAADVWDALQDNAEFLSRLSTTELKNVTLDVLARVLELDRILIGEVVYNAAAEEATDSMTQMYTQDALLLYVPKRPSIRTPSAGYTFKWKKNGLPPEFIRKMRLDTKNADRVEIQTYLDYKLVSADLGVFFNGVLT